MLQTVEVEVDVNGEIEWLEPVTLTRKSRGILTILGEAPSRTEKPVTGLSALQAFLQSPEFANRKQHSAEEIDAYIQEMRDSWD